MWEILVPTIMNGKPVRTRHHRQWDAYVRKLSGGLTILHPAKGQWVRPQDGQLVAERMIPVRIICDEFIIRKIVKFTLTHYNQEAVLAYKVSDNVILVHK